MQQGLWTAEEPQPWALCSCQPERAPQPWLSYSPWMVLTFHSYLATLSSGTRPQNFPQAGNYIYLLPPGTAVSPEGLLFPGTRGADSVLRGLAMGMMWGPCPEKEELKTDLQQFLLSCPFLFSIPPKPQAVLRAGLKWLHVHVDVPVFSVLGT